MSADGDSICGVLACTSEPSVACSQVGVLSLGKVLGVAPGTHSRVLAVHGQSCCAGNRSSLLLAEYDYGSA